MIINNELETQVVPHISVVIPVYKAEGCLDELYRRLTASLEQITSNFEIILVEDCGGDRSWQIIVDLARRDNRVRGIQFSRNFGQHYGITAGLDYCNGDWIVVMDCDLQDRPEDISHLYAKALEGFEIVLARRVQRKEKIFKRLTSWLFYKLFSYLADIDYDGSVGNFRIVSRKVVSSFRLMREQSRFFGGLVNWMGFTTATIDVVHAERFEGETSYTWRKLWALASETIIANSDKPLHLTIRFGLILSLMAFASGIFLMLRTLIYGSPVSGWASLIVSVYLLGGIIIAILGMIGIYLGKTFNESKKRPLYIIMHSTFGNDRGAH